MLEARGGGPDVGLPPRIIFTKTMGGPVYMWLQKFRGTRPSPHDGCAYVSKTWPMR